MTDLTLTELASAIAARKVSAVEATQACLDRIARLDGRLHAFITVDAPGALARARSLDADLASGTRRGPLHGVPLAYKDLFHVVGLPTSCGTKTAEYFRSDHDSTAVARLTAAGAVTLGKLNMTELALGPFGDNPHHGNVDNPWKAGLHLGRLLERLGRRRGRPAGLRRAGLRHGRLDPPARGLLRHRRD